MKRGNQVKNEFMKVRREKYKLVVSVQEPWYGRLNKTKNYLEPLGITTAIIGLIHSIPILVEMASILLSLVIIVKISMIETPATSLNVSNPAPSITKSNLKD